MFKSSGESDGKKESTEQIHQERDENQVSSSSSIIPNPVVITKKAEESTAKPVNQHIISSSTDTQLIALLKKPVVQKPFSEFRQRATSTSPLSQTSEAISSTKSTQNQKLCSWGVGATKGWKHAQQAAQNHTTSMTCFESLPSGLSSFLLPFSFETADIPQLKELKDQIASRKKKKVRKVKASLKAPPAVQALSLKTTEKTNNGSIDQSSPQRSSESVKAFPSETQIIHTNNPVSTKNTFQFSEILNFFIKNESTSDFRNSTNCQK